MAERDRDAVHERILRDERRRNGRRMTALRAVVVGFFLCNALVMVYVMRAWDANPGTALIAGYFVLSVALALIVRRSDEVAVRAPLVVPFLDVPFVFTVQAVSIPSRDRICSPRRSPCTPSCSSSSWWRSCR